MTTHRYIASGTVFAVSAIVMAVASAAPAYAQGPLRPVESLIINGPSEPVPVKVVTTASATPVVCTFVLTGSSGPTGFVNSSVTRKPASDGCAPGTKLDVSRILFAPDIGIPSQNLATYRVTVAVTQQASTFFLNEVVAVLTDGAPEAPPIQPFRLDTTGGQFVVALSAGSAGGAATPVSIAGALILVGTPVQ